MKILLTTVVDKKYADYIPMFNWCAKTAYPEYDVKIFVNDSELLRYENTHLMFCSFPEYRYSAIAWRFAVAPKNYDGYDYVYVTDIDIMLMRENPPLHIFHIEEMKRHGLSYSNSTRNGRHYMGKKSLSGLHFMSKEFIKKAKWETYKYNHLLSSGLVGHYREYDGVMLYRIAKESGAGISPKSKLAVRHHGIHLGNFRLFKSRKKWARRISRQFAQKWRGYCDQPAFKKILDMARLNDTIRNQTDLMDNFIQQEYSC